MRKKHEMKRAQPGESDKEALNGLNLSILSLTGVLFFSLKRISCKMFWTYV